MLVQPTRRTPSRMGSVILILIHLLLAPFLRWLLGASLLPTISAVNPRPPPRPLTRRAAPGTLGAWQTVQPRGMRTRQSPDRRSDRARYASTWRPSARASAT